MTERERMAGIIETWVRWRQPPLRLNLQDPIVITSYAEGIPETFFDMDPRVHKIEMRRTGNRWTIMVWLV